MDPNIAIRIAEADTQSAFIGNIEGYDIAVINRILTSGSPEHTKNLLTDDQWQDLVNVIDEALHASLAAPKRATVSWRAQDLMSLYPDRFKTLSEADEALADVEEHLSDRLTEIGWDILGDLIN